MHTAHQRGYPELRSLGRRVGYGAAVLFQLLVLWVVQNLVEWDVLPFLTSEFLEVVPWISFSLLVGIAVNLAYLVFDDFTLHSVGEVGLSLINLIVAWQVFVVFPFDFSMYDFDWGLVARIVLIMGMVGAAIGAVALVVKLVRHQGRREKGEPDAYGV